MNIDYHINLVGTGLLMWTPRYGYTVQQRVRLLCAAFPQVSSHLCAWLGLGEELLLFHAPLSWRQRNYK